MDKKKGRKPTTGNYGSREDLVHEVVRDYRTSPPGVSDDVVGRWNGVSGQTVRLIMANEAPPPPACPYCKSTAGYNQIMHVREYRNHSWYGIIEGEPKKEVFYSGSKLKCRDCGENVTSYVKGLE